EIEHLNILLLSKDSHIDSLKQAMLLLENHQAKLTESPAPWWKFWKKS
ncbi:transcriptional regulator, partial [Klebsiella quasipneumoniae subsp. quasipneumoniae]